MHVLIYGVNTTNKGAQLLLSTVASQLLRMGHTPVVSARDVDRATRREFGAEPLYSVERLGPARSGFWNFAPQSVSRWVGVHGDMDFDYVLDASGYSLTDAWGVQPFQSRINRLERWSRRNIRLSFLPQAFGPFDGKMTSVAARKLFPMADRIWARDAASASYVEQVFPSHRPPVVPDITIGHDVAPSVFGELDVVIVPNWNIATRVTNHDQSYVGGLAEIVEGLTRQGRRVTGLCHEGDKDLAILTEVSERVPFMEIINPASGTECKAAIATAQFLVAGRYHAAVSGLSAGVPTLVHSWSHKYQALLDDFGVSEWSVDPFDAKSAIEMIETLDHDLYTGRLQVALPLLRSRLDTLWQEVDSLLR